MAIGDTLNQNPFGKDYDAEEEERKKAELAAQNARMDSETLPALDSNIVSLVPGIKNIRNPGAFDPTNIEPVEQVGPPTTVGESISQTYNESVLADLINKGFGQEAFQSQALDGTPTYSIYNKRFGTLGSQVPYSESSPEAKAQAMKFMLGTGGQERPLPETPTSPVRTPEQVQSILDKQQAAQAASNLEATQGVAPPVETPLVGAQEQSTQSAGMTMNQQAIANALAGTNAQSQEEGQVTATPPPQTLSQFMRYEDAPEQRTEQFVDEQGRLRFRPTQEALRLQAQGEVTQPPVDALSSFEQDSLSRQQRIGGTGSFEGDSEARDARVREMDRRPGESQADRDTRVAQSRTTGGQAGSLSFDDARRRAEGELAERGVRNPSASQVNALARLKQAEEPERLAKLETQRALDEATLRQTNTKMGFEPRLIDVGGERAMELSPGYFQRIAKDKPNKTGLQATLDSLQDDLTSGRLTQEQHDIAVANATNIYIGLKEPKQNEIDVSNKIAKLQKEAMGTTPADGNAEGDKKLDKETAQSILNEAGGDKEEARRIARERGFVL